MRELQEVYLPEDGFEALRLSDVEGLQQEEASHRMGVSRQTYGRILSSARRIVARAVVEGLALRIDGGSPCLMAERLGSSDENAITVDREEIMAVGKVAVSVQGKSLDDPVDPRFGRAAGFLVVDVASMESKFVPNGPSSEMASGAGIQAAQRIADSGAKILLTGKIGPKAQRALNAAGIRTVEDLDGLTAREAVRRLTEGRDSSPAA
jgi:predicted Fe-Mo cluster-binding NifX family protein/predicted DNA-binding protein (UPF0251 family)